MDYANDPELIGEFEWNYKALILRFISLKTNVDTFVNEFTVRWRLDRGVDVSDKKFRRMIDRLFTSCDCYATIPNRAFSEITEAELRKEVELLSHIWWKLPRFEDSVKVRN